MLMYNPLTLLKLKQIPAGENESSDHQNNSGSED